MTVSLRGATADDIEALLALWRRATHPSVSDDVASLRTLIQRDGDAVVVAVDGAGEMVGSVIAGFDGWRAGIYRLAVDPAWRRRGVASQLLAAAEDRFRGLGVRRCQAIVISTDDEAMVFWRSTAWAEDDDRARFVRDNVDAGA